MTGEERRVCKLCSVLQPLIEFYQTNKGRNHSHVCRSCHLHKAWMLKHDIPFLKTHPLLAAVRRPAESCRMHFPHPCNCPAIARLTPEQREQVQVDWMQEYFDDKSKKR